MGGDERALDLRKRQIKLRDIARRIHRFDKRGVQGLSELTGSGAKRFQAWRIYNLIGVNELATAGRFSGETQRQEAERAGRQPDEPATRPYTEPLQLRIEASGEQGPQGRAHTLNGGSPFTDPRPLFLPGQVLDVVGPEPATDRVLLTIAAQKLVETARRETRQVERTDGRTVRGRGDDDDLAPSLSDDRGDNRPCFGHHLEHELHGPTCRNALGKGLSQQATELILKRAQMLQRVGVFNPLRYLGRAAPFVDFGLEFSMTLPLFL